MRHWLIAVLILAGCSGREAEPPADTGLLTPEEMAATPPLQEEFDDFSGLEPIAVEHAGKLLIQLVSENGYDNARKQHVVDILERDLAYIAVSFRNEDGRPVSGARPVIAALHGSRIIPMAESAANAKSDDSGTFEFGVVAGAKGEDVITVSLGDARAELVLNVISLAAAGYAGFDDVPGALRWDELMQARLRFVGDAAVEAEFTPAVTALHGQRAKLVGFMMPLDTDTQQKHFLLTSTPPSCFFHVPGGPAGAIEVFAPKGVAVSWEPMILEGQFETVKRSEIGVIYRLKDAVVVKK